MMKEMKNKKAHVLLLPLPAQGHINPILQFGKRLASKGVKVTLATTVFLAKFMHLKDCKIRVETISDGFDETGPGGIKLLPEWKDIYFKSLRDVGTKTLADMFEKHNNHNSDDPITCLVCDAVLPWALDVGKEFGLVTASFYTQPCGVSSIFYHVNQGKLKVPVEESTVSLPGLPLLAHQDLHSSVVIVEPAELGLLLGQFSNNERADWLFFNEFEKMEADVLKLMGKIWRVRAIGPTTPSMYLDKRIEGDTENSLNIFKPSECKYMKWLDAKQAGSVLYISFGSMAELEEEHMEEIIWGIKESNKDFMWVVRESEQCKLPDDFAEAILDRGLAVPWCSQLEVLAHESIGCFLTHCGWNSTMEALSLGVPMVVMPQMWDQFTNAKFVEEVWEIGLRANKDEKGIVRRNALASCIRKVMDGEKGEVIKMNAKRWRESAKEAVDIGGSSDVNIVEFLASIK